MKYSNSNDINKYIDSIRLSANYKLLELTNEQLVERYQQAGEGKPYLEALISKNIAAVLQIAKKYNGINQAYSLFDLIDAGVQGLIQAAKSYNGTRENAALFITYMINIVNKEIFAATNGKKKYQQEDIKAFRDAKRLDVPISEDAEDSDDTLLDTIEDENAYNSTNVIERLFMQQIHNELNEVMEDTLSLKVREIVKFLYGWNCPEMSVKEVAELFEISSQRVGQIRNAAFKKIRESEWAERGRAYNSELTGCLCVKRNTYNQIEYNIDRKRDKDIQDKKFMDNYFSELFEIEGD